MPTSNALYSSRAAGQTGGSQVVACLDRSENSAGIVPHAFAIARALDIPVTLLQVLDSPQGLDMRPDPLEWDLRRHEARLSLGQLAAAPGASGAIAQVKLAEGATADEICRLAQAQPDSLLVLGTHGENGAGHRGIGGTTHHVLDRAPGSILLVPPAAAGAASCNYRRILVPVDGSKWAESVLPLAVRLAKSAHAELVLAHIVPTPELTEIRPLEPIDLELQRHVIERNEQAGRAYLEHMRAYIAETDLKVRVISLRADDVRAALASLIRSEGADIVVLSARGHGGRHHADIPYGSVASYLMTHCPVPMLIARPSLTADEPFALNLLHDGPFPATGRH
ncbi:universal stress protein [Sphingobium nicotianae]|uniref:Universal stress protein n=1 Tax=Sphingobium nicotianae TaxID=2782607 RepID=A0A9X1IS99_9SPHN|nr:universal stress protein [Sphingobium nicotianae]MBT2188356.1 universal stress protein [Sphingobium nicotianae]